MAYIAGSLFYRIRYQWPKASREPLVFEGVMTLAWFAAAAVAASQMAAGWSTLSAQDSTHEKAVIGLCVAQGCVKSLQIPVLGTRPLTASC